MKECGIFEIKKKCHRLTIITSARLSHRHSRNTTI
jgi:hypothetical protein